MKSLCKYNTFKKRDGSFVTAALNDDGKLLTGEELEEALLQDYCRIHG